MKTDNIYRDIGLLKNEIYKNMAVDEDIVGKMRTLAILRPISLVDVYCIYNPVNYVEKYKSHGEYFP